MQTTQGPTIPLPDPETIRARLDHLQEERALLRDLLRVVVRIEGQRLKTATKPPEGLANVHS